MSDPVRSDDCPLPECPYLEDKKNIWIERAKLLPFLLALIMAVVGAFTAFQQSRIDAANVIQSEEIRRGYVSKELYEKDEMRREADRRELKDWMKRIEDKLDRLPTKR